MVTQPNAVRRRSPRRRRTKAQISFNMSQIRSSGSKIELIMENELLRLHLTPEKQPRMIGRPDFVFPEARVAVFCDSHFWHGYRWKERQQEIKRNRDFWIRKIEGNISRDREVNRKLRKAGWMVFRFWERQILRSSDKCALKIKDAVSGRMSEG